MKKDKTGRILFYVITYSEKWIEQVLFKTRLVRLRSFYGYHKSTQRESQDTALCAF